MVRDREVTVIIVRGDMSVISVKVDMEVKSTDIRVTGIGVEDGTMVTVMEIRGDIGIMGVEGMEVRGALMDMVVGVAMEEVQGGLLLSTESMIDDRHKCKFAHSIIVATLGVLIKSAYIPTYSDPGQKLYCRYVQ